MDSTNLRKSASSIWALVREQHGVIARRQLLELGMKPHEIRYRVDSGRLHPVWRGVYAVGRPELSRLGRWMAAVLACGRGAVLSYDSAAALWRIGTERVSAIQISVPAHVIRRRSGIDVHRRALLVPPHVTVHHGIPVTSPALTLVDLSTRLGTDSLEAAVNEADKLDLIDPEELRQQVEELAGRHGAPALRRLLDRRTFRATDSWVERQLMAMIRRRRLPIPETRRNESGFRIDLYWPELGLVVEGDGLRYHRTPGQQTRDRLRDQAHTVAGLVTLRFTHAQIRYEPDYVEGTLAAVVARLQAARDSRGIRAPM